MALEEILVEASKFCGLWFLGTIIAVIAGFLIGTFADDVESGFGLAILSGIGFTVLMAIIGVVKIVF